MRLPKRSPVEKLCVICGSQFLVHKYREATAKTCSETCRVKVKRPGWVSPTHFRKGVPSWSAGKVFSAGHCRRLSDSHKGKPGWRRGKPYPQASGSRNCNWKGGISLATRTARQNIMSSLEYKRWRSAVFERDNWTCRICGVRSSTGIKVILEAHHLQSFKEHPDLRFEIDNGSTLCRACHYTARRARHG